MIRLSPGVRGRQSSTKKPPALTVLLQAPTYTLTLCGPPGSWALWPSGWVVSQAPFSQDSGSLPGEGTRLEHPMRERGGGRQRGRGHVVGSVGLMTGYGRTASRLPEP